jgi:two-component system KDP operon response regulator KdpE
LAEHPGRALSHELLLERVWGEDFKRCSHYLRLYMGYLRHKLEEDPRNPRLLLTEWGVGYRLATEHLGAARKTARPARAAWA